MVVCVNCGKLFWTWNSNRKFCSLICYHNSRIGRPSTRMSESLQKFYSKHPQKVERLRQYTFNTRFQKGHSVPEEWKERYRQRRLGHKLSEESKTKITRNLLKFYLEHPEMRERFSRERKGMNHWNWKGGKTAGIE